MFGGSSIGQKIDDDVDFSLTLDMSKHVLGKEIKDENMIYDCYAVSNHMGGMGGGHYTAYCKSEDERWYEFDDFHVSAIKEDSVQSTVVSSAAYNIFYRRRDWHENNVKNGVDFDELAYTPDLGFLEKKNSEKK